MDAIAVVAGEGEGVGVAGEGEGARKMEKGWVSPAFRSLCRWRRGRGGPGEGKGTRLL